MSEESPSIRDRLAKLPRRSIAAFAIRCARRVQPLLLHNQNQTPDYVVRLIDSGLAMVEAWCVNGPPLSDINLMAVRSREITAAFKVEFPATARQLSAAANAAAVATGSTAINSALASNGGQAADYASITANNADVAVAHFSGTDVESDDTHTTAAKQDLQKLELWSNATPDEFGPLIDPREDGPLGSLWHGREPDWYPQLKQRLDVALLSQISPQSNSEPNQASSELNRINEQLIAATKQIKDTFDERDKLQSAFQKQTEAIKKQEEVAAIQRDQLAKQQEFTAQLQLDLAKVQADLTEQQRQRVEAEQLANDFKRQLDFDALRTWGELLGGLNKVSLSGILLGLVCLVLGAAAIGTFMALSEISSRQQYELLLTSNLTHLRDELAKHPTEANDPKPNAMSNQQRLELYEQNLQDIRQLVIVGAYSESHTLAEIAARTNGRRGHANPSEGTKSPLKSGDSNATDALKWWSWLRVWVHFSSEFLLAMVVVACGTIGALIAAMRTQGGRERLTSRALVQNLVMGFSAGFITFFAVRGGKSVFLLHGDAPTFTSNPYTTGFLGLIAGLFTDRAYTVLMKAVDELQKKIEQVITSSNDEGDEDSTPSPTSKPKPDAGPAANEPNKPA